MTTFDDDMARLHLMTGTVTIPLVKLGLSWPPPEKIVIGGDGSREATNEDDPEVVLHRVSVSEITDEQRAGMTHVFRGAEYFYEENLL